MNPFPACCLILLLLNVPAVAVAAERGSSAEATVPVKREIIPGSELMTSQERERYRQRIRNSKTPQEEEKVRSEHIKQMQERARVRGLQLLEPASPSKEIR